MFLDHKTFHEDNVNLIALFKLLSSKGSLRIGGASCDNRKWKGPDSSDYVRLNDLALFLGLTGWRVIYCLNLRTSSASAASEEAQVVKVLLGPYLDGIAIGNEPDSSHYQDEDSNKEILGKFRF